MELNTQEKQTISVLILGAGKTGMLQARHLSTIPNCSITIVEAKGHIGGLWAYDEITEHHPKADEVKKTDNFYKLNNCFHSSIYPHLIINTAKDFTSFKDFTIYDFDPKLPDFLTQKDYLSYQNAYWDHFDLRKYITFNTIVKSIRPYENLSDDERSKIKDLSARKFVVITADAKAEGLSQNEKVSTYDHVIVANGMHSKPYTPQVEGISNFKGTIVHIKDFREADEPIYQEKTILVLGSSYSGLDMVVQFFHCPVKGRQKLRKMILCSNDVAMLENSTDFKPLREEGDLVVKKAWIKELTEDSAVLTDGTTEKVDVVIFCTGYEASYPFFDPADKTIEIGGEECRRKFFGPLYKRLMSIHQPGLLFPGRLDFTVFGSYIGELQTMVVKHIVDGSLKLPSKEEMMREYEQDIAEEKANSKDGSLTNYFRLSTMKGDLVYIESLRKAIEHIYPGSEEKSKKNLERKMSMAKKAGEYFQKGDLLQYRRYDFSGNFPVEFKNTTEFI